MNMITKIHVPYTYFACFDHILLKIIWLNLVAKMNNEFDFIGMHCNYFTLLNIIVTRLKVFMHHHSSISCAKQQYALRKEV